MFIIICISLSRVCSSECVSLEVTVVPVFRPASIRGMCVTRSAGAFMLLHGVCGKLGVRGGCSRGGPCSSSEQAIVMYGAQASRCYPVF